MKLAVVAVVCNLVLAGAVLAQVHTPAPPRQVKIPASLKSVGAPDIAIGPVAKGQIFYRRKLTYARTGVLASALSLTGKAGDVVLPAGTGMFGIAPTWAYQGPVIWCTLPQKDTRQTCLLHKSGAPIWAQQAGDVTFTGSVVISMTPDSAPEPQVDETKPLPEADFAVEFSLGDPDEVDKPIPLKNGQGYIAYSGPRPAMVVAFRYTDRGSDKGSGYAEYPTLGDVIVDGAKLSYDPVAKSFTVSAQ